MQWFLRHLVRARRSGRSPGVLAVLTALLGSMTSPAAQTSPTPTEKWVFREGLALRGAGRGSVARVPFRQDPVEAMWVRGAWRTPQAGDSVPFPDGEGRAWTAVTASADGGFTNFNRGGGYLHASLVLASNTTALLHASGHGMVYVNGEPRGGDVYNNGTAVFPVSLRAGTNHFLFASGRGALRARLLQPPAAASLEVRDLTLPDLREGQSEEMWGGVIVLNNTPDAMTGLSLHAGTGPRGGLRTPVPVVAPFSSRKVGFRIPALRPGPTNRVELTLRLRSDAAGRSGAMDQTRITLRVRRASDTFKRTFVSAMDGSVQYYGVRPATDVSPGEAPAMVLSLHGASVEGIGQADAYGPKPWAHIVAPTNRRPYGFDWEDWGRRDAIEVLLDARSLLGTDPRRTYLTGHSMGGHGTWQVGVTLPDQFAALGPSAGWISFFSYAGGSRRTPAHAVEEITLRAVNPSDTLKLSTNYLQHGIYILHGDADDNVPVREARTMREHLQPFHRNFQWFEQKGAGHWWDSDSEPGASCVDWAPMFDFFARHTVPTADEVREVIFATMNPAVSAKCHWLTIEAQERWMNRSVAAIRRDPGSRQFSGTTENISELTLAPILRGATDTPFKAHLDGQTVSNLLLQTDGVLRLKKVEGRWEPASAPPKSMKGPHRSGPFKEAFAHRMLFVYGTRGTSEENAWSFAKARFDAETWWYRGNGGMDVIADKDFRPELFKDRGVIVYGHAELNGAWASLLSASPVQVRRSALRVGDREEKGDNLGCLFLFPRPDSDVASVAVVAGTGMPGLRATERMPYMLAGVAYPDWVVFTSEAADTGLESVRGAGYFGRTWSLKDGESAWRDR